MGAPQDQHREAGLPCRATARPKDFKRNRLFCHAYMGLRERIAFGVAHALEARGADTGKGNSWALDAAYSSGLSVFPFR